MAFYCCEAVHDENGLLGWEGRSQAGDNNGTEVIRRKIAATGERWQIVYRPKNSTKANIIGESSLQCAVNDHIGYDQSQRLTLYEAWKALPASNRSIMNITADVECDCSAMVAVCCNNAGIAVNPNMRTNIEDSILMATGEFDKITYEQNMTLKKGDILWRIGHTGVVGDVDDEYNTLYVGKIIKYSGVYKTRKVSKKNHIDGYPFLDKGNMIEVLQEEDKFCLVRIANQFIGYVLKSRIKRCYNG